MRFLLTALALAAVLTACGGGSPEGPSGSSLSPSPTPGQQEAPSPTATDEPTPPPDLPLQREVVVAGAEGPVALAIAPDGRIFYNELTTGRVRVVQGGQVLPEPFAAFQVARPPGYTEHGLLGLALDPDFPRNGFVYVFYTVPDSQGRPLHQRVVRLRDQDNRGVDATVIIDGLPTGSRCCHNGGRLAFGPDGKLYISLGDAERPGEAQDPSTLPGTLLRLNPDGSVPADNPFPGSPVYAYGLRNVFGIGFHPLTGELFATENGPSGHDELNVIRRSANYGWPVTMGIAGDGRFVDPIWESGGRSLAPTGLTVYGGNRLPFRGDLFFCTYVGGSLLRVPADQLQEVRDGRRAAVEPLDTGHPCRFDVKAGPDGFLYFSDAENIYRLRPRSG